jgi:DNA-binding transcriptional LysR family regulator
MHLPLRAIAVFHAAARAGSVSRAAQDLGVTPSAVSQQIAALEVHLGTSLMVKTGRRVALTEAGERYFEMIAEHIDRVSEATQNVRGYLSSTSLTVRATPSLATKWLLPRLGRFLDANPDLDVRVDATNEPTDFSREDVDVDIRHGEGNWPGLFVEGIAEERFLPVCAPGLCAAATLDPSDLPSRRLIHSVKSQMQWGDWFAGRRSDGHGDVAARVVRPHPHGRRRRRERDGHRLGKRPHDVARAAGRRPRLPSPAFPGRFARDPMARLPARSAAAPPSPRLPRSGSSGTRLLARRARRPARVTV